MLSYIALIVGAFLIYNTIAISVVRRRNEIGYYARVGAARSVILSGFLAESVFFALFGSVLGTGDRPLHGNRGGATDRQHCAISVREQPALTSSHDARGSDRGIGLGVTASDYGGASTRYRGLACDTDGGNGARPGTICSFR